MSETNNNSNIGITEIETNSATGPKIEGQQQEIEVVTIPKTQYESLLNSNKNGLMIVLEVIDRFDNILDGLADFENMVRQQKIITKNLIKSATTQIQPQTQTTGQTQPQIN